MNGAIMDMQGPGTAQTAPVMVNTWIRGADMAQRTRSIIERFWSKVDKSAGPDACWPWTGHLDSARYGRFALTHRAFTGPHRFALELRLGRALRPDEETRHVVCHNPPCCNPRHLEPGSHVDNVQDSVRAGRRADVRGVLNPQAKLSAEAIDYIRLLRGQGLPFSTIGRRLGISRSAAHAAVAGNTWRHIR